MPVILSRFVVSAALALSAIVAHAEVLPFNAATFQSLQAEGKAVVVDFHAPWCPVCRRQETVINDLTKNDKYKNLTILRADFDTEKSLKSKLNVRSQSTLVVFKGQKEITRSTGDTQPEKIDALFSQALSS